MGGHGHHEPPYTVPDHTIYKVKGVPQLEELEKILAARGLKDPWIRNEVWRYHPGFGSKWTHFRLLFFRGLLLGAALTAATVAYDKTIGKKDDHGHH